MGLRRNSDTTPLREVVERAYRRDREGLIAQLDDPDPSVRRRAVRDLASEPAALAALAARLDREVDGSVREALFTALCQHPGEAAVAALVPLVDHADAALRNAAVEALETMVEHAQGAIGRLLDSPQALTREQGVNLMRGIDTPQTHTRLAMILRDESDANVVAAALDVLAEVGTAVDRPLVAEVVARFPEVPFIRFASEVVLARTGDA